MLDLELVTPPTLNGLDIVSLAEMKRHVRIVHSKLDDVIMDAINDAAGKLHGRNGELNRTVFPCTWKRYLTKFPDYDRAGKAQPIQLPFPPVIEVVEVKIEAGSGPAAVVDPTSYRTTLGMLVPEIHPMASWPSVSPAPRAVSVTYKAGYADFTNERMLKRMIKFLAGHYLENAEATINEMRQIMINRRVDFAIDDLRAALRVPVSYDDWGE